MVAMKLVLSLQKDKSIDTRMTNRIFTFFFAVALFFGGVSVPASAAVEIIEQEFQSIYIAVNGSVLHVTGANNQVLYIYNVAGVCVKSIRVEGNDKHYDLNLPKGCYIVKVGKAVRKISVK